MSGWDDAGELFAEGIDYVVDKHYDNIHEGATRNAHWSRDKLRKWRGKPTKYDRKGNPLPPDEQPGPSAAQDAAEQRSEKAHSVRGDSPPSPDSGIPYGGATDAYGQTANQYSSPRYPINEDNRARDLSGQGQLPRAATFPTARPDTARSVQAPSGYSTSRGIDGMGDNGYGPSDYGRDPRGSSGYDDGYQGGDADDYRRAYRPQAPSGFAPQQPQPYNPATYAPHAGAGTTSPTGGQRYLPPPPATPRAYDDPYDDEGDSDDSYDRRRRARKSKSETGLRRYDSRGSMRSDRRSERDRGRDGSDDEDGERGEGEHKGPKHKMVATIGGALVGAIAGYEISNRRGKPESFHTIAGAIVGAVGAREADKWWENRQEEKKEKDHKRRHGGDEEKDDGYYDQNGRYQF